MSKRRAFLAQLGATAATLTFDAGELRASPTAASGPWDMSWLDQLAAAKYRVVFNASEIADGIAMDYASTFYDHFHEADGTTDRDTRPVIVFRRLGTPMALNDAMWDRYAIGEDRKVMDSATHAPAHRNVYAPSIEALRRRGLISLVCNIALGNVAAGAAQKTQRNADDVRAEFKANLVPGAIVVPSGIYALIRAQNAGCAFMQGT
jgi:hypothetical protein